MGLALIVLMTGCRREPRVWSLTDDPDWTVVWADEFDYEGPPDPARWTHDQGEHGWGNGELQRYTLSEDNAFVSDGVLTIRAIYGDSESRFGYTSARIHSRGKGDFVYGRYEVRARVPVGRGLWSAAWLLYSTDVYGGWPRGGEIDIMENVGFEPETIHGTVHTEAFNHMKNTQRGGSLTVKNLDSRFHTFAVDRREDRIDYYVDDKLYFTFSKESDDPDEWPFDTPFHWILNLAVGGTWGGMRRVDALDVIFGDEG